MEETDGDFSERLQAAIDDAREEIDKETEQYRTDLEKAYRAKVGVTDNGYCLECVVHCLIVMGII